MKMLIRLKKILEILMIMPLTSHINVTKTQRTYNRQIEVKPTIVADLLCEGFRKEIYDHHDDFNQIKWKKLG